jgi:hypothetical protein
MLDSMHDSEAFEVVVEVLVTNELFVPFLENATNTTRIVSSFVDFRNLIDDHSTEIVIVCILCNRERERERERE